MKIGLIADTHMPGSIEQLWEQADEVLAGSDAILHAGDLHTLDIVEHLSGLAPTYVSRGNGDIGIDDERLQDNWLFNFGGVNIGLIHHFPSPIRKSPEQLEKHLNKHFSEQLPEVLIYGHTHLEGISAVNNRLYINPGSPTLPRNQSLRLGTLGILEIEDQHVTATIFQLTDHGAVGHAEIIPFQHPRQRSEVQT